MKIKTYIGNVLVDESEVPESRKEPETEISLMAASILYRNNRNPVKPYPIIVIS